jgi:hypothetical protein
MVTLGVGRLSIWAKLLFVNHQIGTPQREVGLRWEANYGDWEPRRTQQSTNQQRRNVSSQLKQYQMFCIRTTYYNTTSSPWTWTRRTGDLRTWYRSCGEKKPLGNMSKLARCTENIGAYTVLVASLPARGRKPDCMSHQRGWTRTFQMQTCLQHGDGAPTARRAERHRIYSIYEGCFCMQIKNRVPCWSQMKCMCWKIRPKHKKAYLPFSGKFI